MNDKEYLSINEFSKFSGIAPSTLRFWDEIGIFTPHKRDPKTNYRYYSLQQITAVKFVSVLVALNVPLKTIGKMDTMRTPQNIINLIEQQEIQLKKEMSRLLDRFSIIHVRRDLINCGIHEDPKKIEVRSIGLQKYILGPLCNFKENEPFYEPFLHFCQQADELGINLSLPIGGYHESMERFLKAPGKPDRFFSLDPTGTQTRPAGKYLIGTNRGYYGEMGDLPKRMAAYAAEHSLTLSNPVYALYLHDEICTKDPSQYLVQIITML